jgi:hypothetical protein
MILLAAGGLLAVPADTPEPEFTESDELLRPESYRDWVFIGSGLGMSYTEKGYDEAPDFTNVYMRPEAFRAFVKTGKFPSGTVFILEIRAAASEVSINKRGRFQDRLIGIEAAVKDEKRFREKWAYFSFIGKTGEPLSKAKPFPQDACWSCHNQHAADDNVFLQFYPALREARATQ